MAKQTLGKKPSNISRADALIADTLDRGEMQIEDVVIMSKSQMNTKAETRNKRIQTVVRPSEYDVFISKIGRMSESDAIRELILIATDQPTNKPKEREFVLAMIKNSSQI